MISTHRPKIDRKSEYIAATTTPEYLPPELRLLK
jgi:hypothetical protein